MKILQSRPDTAKINGEPVKGNLLKIKKSIIRVDKFLKKDLTKSQRESEKLRRSIEKSSRLKKEKRIESKDDNTKKSFAGKVRVPSLGIFGSLKKFISTVVLGFFAIKLIPLLPKLIPIAVGLGKFVNFIITIGGRFLNGFISLVDFGVRAGDATTGFIKQIGGEKTAEVFSKFGGAITGLIDAAILIGTLSLFESGQDYMFDQKNRKPKGPKGRGPLKGVKRSLRRKSLKTFGRGATKTLGKFGKGGPLAAIFTVFDFMGRKSEGQSNLQAGLGSGAGLGGFAAGAKIGASIGTAVAPGIGTAIGGLVGGVIGSFIGSSISDKVTGADKVQGRNEGGLVKRKEQDRFKSKEQTMKVGGSISPIEFDSITKKIFPNDVEGMPDSGEYISNSFKDVNKTPFIGPLMGLSYKMLTGQGMSNDEFQVASNNLKAGAKFGFSPEMLKKSFTDASGKVTTVRSNMKMPPIPRPPKFVQPILDAFNYKDDGKRSMVATTEFKLLRKIALIAGASAIALAAIVTAIAVFVAGFTLYPALAAIVTKLATAGKVTTGIGGLKGLGATAAKGVTRSKNLFTIPRSVMKPKVTTGGGSSITVGRAATRVTEKGADDIIRAVRTRVQVENAMNPLRMRKPGEDVIGNILSRSGRLNPNITVGSTRLTRAEQVKARFDRLIDLRKAKSDLVGTGRRGTQNIRRGRIGKDFRIERPIGKQSNETLDMVNKMINRTGDVKTGQTVLTNLRAGLTKQFDAAIKAGNIKKSKEIETAIKALDRTLKSSKVNKLDDAAELAKRVQEGESAFDDVGNSIMQDRLRRFIGTKKRGTETMSQEAIERLSRELGLGKKTFKPDFGRGIKKTTPTEGDVLNTPKNFDALDRTFGSRTGFNLGGFVRGAGGTDMIPARLTSGEFVIDKDSTDYLRATMPGFLAGINKAKYDDVLPVLQSYASYENGFGKQDIVVVAPTTEINNMSGQQMASAPMINAGGSGEDPFEVLAKG